MKFKRIVICGKGGSGKDHLRKILVEQGLNYSVSVTSRPIRLNETDGIDYTFLSKDEASQLIDSGDLYEYCVFNEWIYGTKKELFHSCNLFILTPKGISQIREEDRKDTVVVYLDISESIRKERLSVRGDADSVERRLAADDEDFKDFCDWDLMIGDHNFTTESTSFLSKIVEK
jgi:guanylate kinase